MPPLAMRMGQVYMLLLSLLDYTNLTPSRGPRRLNEQVDSA